MKKLLFESKPDPVWNEIEYGELSEFLLKERGFLFSAYRDGCILRRIASRLNATRSRYMSDYIRLIKNNTDELNNLYNALTINVSSFFRNKEVFDFIAEHVLPDTIKQKMQSGDKFINIWSVGCSTGEEPYSIVFLIERFLKIRLKQFRILINAVDIDVKALDFAKSGIYSHSKLADIDPKIIRTCFIRVGDRYQVRDLFRNMVEFGIQDILDFKPVKTIFDLILCRNMLIYFSNENHLKAYNYFYQHLSSGGYLVLGKAEVMFLSGKNGFEQASIKNRVYRKAV